MEPTPQLANRHWVITDIFDLKRFYVEDYAKLGLFRYNVCKVPRGNRGLWLRCGWLAIFSGWIKVHKPVRKLIGNRGGNHQASVTGFTLIELLLVIVIIGILVAIAMPSFYRLKDKAKEAEAKANIHNIQLSIERFAVDFSDDYPSYLIGGDNATRNNPTGVIADSNAAFDTPTETSADPLIRHGYVDGYPRNPFIRNRKPVERYQAAIGDPLRNGNSSSLVLGTRFGPHGNLVGQVLCDPRWLTWTYFDREKGKPEQLSTWANMQYRCYDIWHGNRAKPFLPGTFMYKSMGEIIPTPSSSEQVEFVDFGDQKMKKMDNRGRTTIPINNSSYVLAANGGIRTKGIDILGEEPLIIFSYQGTTVGEPQDMFIYDPGFGRYRLPRPTATSFQLIGIPSWTRGVNRSHVGPLWGSPFSPADDSTSQLKVGNPNGLREAIILVLTPDGAFTD